MNDNNFQHYLNWRSIPPLIRGKGKDIFIQSGYNLPDLLELATINTTDDFKERFEVSDETLFQWDDRIEKDNLLEKSSLRIKRELTKNIDFGMYRNLMTNPTASNYKSWYELVHKDNTESERQRTLFNDLLKMQTNRLVEVIDKTARTIFEGIKVGTTRKEGFWNTDLPVVRKIARIIGGRRVPIDDPAAYPDLIYFPDMDTSKTIEVFDLGKEYTTEIIERDEKANLEVASDKALRCDTCYARASCEKFRESAACAFNFSVSIESPGELQTAFLYIINREVERLNRAFYFEKLDGGALNKTISNEVEKFARLVATVKYLGAPLKDEGADMSNKFRGKPVKPVIDQLFGDLAIKPQPIKEKPIQEPSPTESPF